MVHQVKPDNVGYSSSAIIQAKATENLRCMTWKDSPYNTEHILEKLESQGSRGNKVLLEGIKTGSAKVSVKLVDPHHTLVPHAVEPLMVVANLFLLPPAAFIMPCAALDYTANQFRGLFFIVLN